MNTKSNGVTKNLTSLLDFHHGRMSWIFLGTQLSLTCWNLQSDGVDCGMEASGNVLVTQRKSSGFQTEHLLKAK